MMADKLPNPSQLSDSDLVLIGQNARNGWDEYPNHYLMSVSAEWQRRKAMVCHAKGDRCLGCDHYHGKAKKCIYAP